MRTRLSARWRLVVFLTVVAFAVAGAVYAVAGHQAAGVASYTGCLNTSSGTVVNLALGDVPMDACKDKETQIHLSGGDVTGVTPGVGLVGGGSGGDVSLGVDPAAVQTRISGDCLSPGEAIQAINQDGSVSCTVGPRAFAHFAEAGGDVDNHASEIGSLTLPPGNWIVIAKVVMNLQFPLASEEVWRATCNLSGAPNGDLARTGGDTDFEGSGTLTMIAPAISGTPQTVTVSCGDSGDNPTFGDADWQNLSIVAIRLGDLIVN
jgi:hypothetical protein